MKTEAEIRLVLENITRAFNDRNNIGSQAFDHQTITALHWVLGELDDWWALSALERYMGYKKRKAPIEEHLLEYLERIKKQDV